MEKDLGVTNPYQQKTILNRQDPTAFLRDLELGAATMNSSNQVAKRHPTFNKTIGCSNNHGGDSKHQKPVRCSPHSSWNHLDLSERAPNSSLHPPFRPDRGKSISTNSGSVSMLDFAHRSNICLEERIPFRPPSPKPTQEVDGAGFDVRRSCSLNSRQLEENKTSKALSVASAFKYRGKPNSTGVPVVASFVPSSWREEQGDREREEEEEEGWWREKSTEMDRWCAVCGDTAKGNFFGANVCLPCKSFFIRCTKEGGLDIQKECDGRCNVRRQIGHRCQYCRFQRCCQVGMKRKEKPEVVVAGEGQTLCRVCGDLANGIHFGVFTCEGCKKFFRRSLQDHRSYVCRGDGFCSLNPRNRKHCRRCRYLKCKAVGMSEDATRMYRPYKRRRGRTRAQRIAFYSRGPAPSLQDSNPCHPSLHPSPPSPLGDSATKHPLSLTRDVQACGRHGGGKRFLTKHGCLPRCCPYQKRWSCPQKLGNRNIGFHELKIRSHRSVAEKPVPFDAPLWKDASLDCLDRPSTPVSLSSPQNTVQVAISCPSHGHVQCTSLDHMARITLNTFSTCVDAPLIRDAVCVCTDSSVLPQPESINQQSLRPTVSSVHGPFSSLNPNSGPQDKPVHQLSVSNPDGFTASQHARFIKKHAYTVGLENTPCSPSELTGSKPQNSTTSVQCLQSCEHVPSPWRAVGNEPQCSSEGLDLCRRKPSQGPSSFTKQASTEVQHEHDIIQECEIIPPRFTDSRIQSLNSTSTQPFSSASVSIPNMNTEDSLCDSQPLDLSCSGRLRQSPSGPEHRLQQRRIHTPRGSLLRASEPAEQPTMRTRALVIHQHCQDLNDRPFTKRRENRPESPTFKNLDNSSLHLMQSCTRPIAEKDRGSREPEFMPLKVCSCQLIPPTPPPPPPPPPGQVLQPAEPLTPCHVIHNKQTPSCPAPVTDKGIGVRVIRRLLDMNGQDLDKITGVVSGMVNLLELIRDKRGLSNRFLSNVAK